MERSSTAWSAWIVGTVALALAGCGGGNSGGGGVGPPPAPGPVTGNISLVGKITFDRPSYSPANTLNFNLLQRLPARGVVVEILRSPERTLLASGVTDANGDYAATFAAASFIVSAKAAMFKAGLGGYDFEIRNNTSGKALYALEGTPLTPTSNSMMANLNAPTGWGGASYTGTRSAAPFAILDTLWRAKELIQAAEPGLALPALDVYWSSQNRAGGCNGSPNPDSGEIGTTFYLGGVLPASGGCPAVAEGVYVMGDASGDAADDNDEFDSSVIAHELAHFYEHRLARSDSMGGPHGLNSKLDLRIAVSEGWGNAFQGFVLNDPVYRDTFGSGGNLAFFFDLENDGARPFADATGYFSEASAADFLWDAYDPANEPDDAMDFGFGPIHAAMRNDYRNTDAMASIYVLATGLAARVAGSETAIRNRLAGELIQGFGDFGSGESSAPGDPGGIPVYRSVTFGVPVQVTSINDFADSGDTDYASYNRQGGRRYLRIDQPFLASLRIRVTGGTDPDFALYRRGLLACEGSSGAFAVEDQLCVGLQPGTYVLEVNECTNLGQFYCGSGPPRGPTNLNVTVTQQ